MKKHKFSLEFLEIYYRWQEAQREHFAAQTGGMDAMTPYAKQGRTNADIMAHLSALDHYIKTLPEFKYIDELSE